MTYDIGDRQVIIDLKTRNATLSSLPWVAYLGGKAENRPMCDQKQAAWRRGRTRPCKLRANWLYVLRDGTPKAFCSHHIFNYSDWQIPGSDMHAEYSRSDQWLRAHTNPPFKE